MNADVANRILTALEQVHLQAPELRFGQLIAIVGELAVDETGCSLWDVEDADSAVALDRFAADLARRQPSTAEPAAPPDRGGHASSTRPTRSQPPRPVS
jgi:hypothetical protein